MINYHIWSRRLILALMIIAAIVAVGQVLQQNVMWLVAIYWLVLFAKTWCDWRGQG